MVINSNRYEISRTGKYMLFLDQVTLSHKIINLSSRSKTPERIIEAENNLQFSAIDEYRLYDFSEPTDTKNQGDTKDFKYKTWYTDDCVCFNVPFKTGGYLLVDASGKFMIELNEANNEIFCHGFMHCTFEEPHKEISWQNVTKGRKELIFSPDFLNLFSKKDNCIYHLTTSKEDPTKPVYEKTQNVNMEIVKDTSKTFIELFFDAFVVYGSPEFKFRVFKYDMQEVPVSKVADWYKGGKIQVCLGPNGEVAMYTSRSNILKLDSNKGEHIETRKKMHPIYHMRFYDSSLYCLFEKKILRIYISNGKTEDKTIDLDSKYSEFKKISDYIYCVNDTKIVCIDENSGLEIYKYVFNKTFTRSVFFDGRFIICMYGSQEEDERKVKVFTTNLTPFAAYKVRSCGKKFFYLRKYSHIYKNSLALKNEIKNKDEKPVNNVLLAHTLDNVILSISDKNVYYVPLDYYASNFLSEPEWFSGNYSNTNMKYNYMAEADRNLLNYFELDTSIVHPSNIVIQLVINDKTHLLKAILDSSIMDFFLVTKNGLSGFLALIYKKNKKVLRSILEFATEGQNQYALDYVNLNMGYLMQSMELSDLAIQILGMTCLSSNEVVSVINEDGQKIMDPVSNTSEHKYTMLFEEFDPYENKTKKLTQFNNNTNKLALKDKDKDKEDNKVEDNNPNNVANNINPTKDKQKNKNLLVIQESIWGELYNKDIGIRTYSKVYPFTNLLTYEILKTIQDSSNMNIYYNVGFAGMIDAAWDKTFFHYFLIHFFLSLAFTIFACLSVISISDKDLIGADFIMVLCGMPLLLLEFHEMRSNIYDYIQNVWNYFDLLAYFFCGLFFFMKLGFNWQTTVTLEMMEAITTIGVIFIAFVFIHLLKMLRGFEQFGYLVRTLIANAVDMSMFLVLMIIIIVCYSIIMMTLYVKPAQLEDITLRELFKKGNTLNDEDYSQMERWSTFGRSLFSTVLMSVLGDYDIGYFENTYVPFLGFVAFFSMILIIMIIMLNALIALLGDSLARVQEQSQAYSKKEKLAFIIDYLSLMGEDYQLELMHKHKYVHVLYSEDFEDESYDNSSNDEWEGQVKTLKDFLRKGFVCLEQNLILKLGMQKGVENNFNGNIKGKDYDNLETEQNAPLITSPLKGIAKIGNKDKEGKNEMSNELKKLRKEFKSEINELKQLILSIKSEDALAKKKKQQKQNQGYEQMDDQDQDE